MTERSDARRGIDQQLSAPHSIDVRAVLALGDARSKAGDWEGALAAYKSALETYHERRALDKVSRVADEMWAILTTRSLGDANASRWAVEVANIFLFLNKEVAAFNVLDKLAEDAISAGAFDVAQIHVDQMKHLWVRAIKPVLRAGELALGRGDKETAIMHYMKASDLLKTEALDDRLSVYRRIVTLDLAPPDARKIADELIALGGAECLALAFRALSNTHRANRDDIETLALLARYFERKGDVSRHVRVLKEVAVLAAASRRHDVQEQASRDLRRLAPGDPELTLLIAKTNNADVSQGRDDSVLIGLPPPQPPTLGGELSLIARLPVPQDAVAASTIPVQEAGARHAYPTHPVSPALTRGVRIDYSRLPYPVAFAGLSANRKVQTNIVFAAAERVIQFMLWTVLIDILDVEWPSPVERSFRCGIDSSKGLEKISLGTYVSMLHHAVSVHNGKPDRILPSLQEWWTREKSRFDDLVRERNEAVHHAVLIDTPPEAVKRRLSELVSEATWLREMQLLSIDECEAIDGCLQTQATRWRGASPTLDPICLVESRLPIAFAISKGRVYLASADGSRWSLQPFMRVEPHGFLVTRDIRNTNGNLRFACVDDTAKEEQIERPIPDTTSNAGWRELSWTEFFQSRQAYSRSWRMILANPHEDWMICERQIDGVRADAVLGERYKLTQLLGGGGFAAVWAAVELSTGVSRAIKIPLPHVIASSKEMKRFRHEYAQLRRLGDKRCRRLIGPVEELRFRSGGDTVFAIVMPVMESTVADELKKTTERGEPIPQRDLDRWTMQALEALADLHAEEVVHRDIKPSNLLIDNAGDIVVGDFGVARETSRESARTRSGVTRGSTAYMAPEQRARPDEVDGRADVYALAMTMHQAATGALSESPGKEMDGYFGELLRAMGAHDPADRPHAADALERLKRALAASS